MNRTPIHFVSYSSLNTDHSCPKKFELDKMGPAQPEFENINFAYGHALGAGIQELFTSGNLKQAYYKAFLAWNMDILASGDPFTQGSFFKQKNSFPWVIEALKKFYGSYLVLKNKWKLFHYFDEKTREPKPAVELSARVEFPNGYVYRIFIDMVLQNIETEELLVLELKSDGGNYKQPEKYANSNQALSYSVILDRIQPGNASFVVWYAVYYKQLDDWEFYDFPKSRLQKANWIRTVLYDTNNIETCRTAHFFPKQGESCIDYGRPCRYYGICDLSERALYASEQTLEERVDKEEKKEYTYRFTLDEIIDQQLEDIKG